MAISLPSVPRAASIGWRTPAVIVACGCMISLLSFGPRASLGFFLTPMSLANGWDRDVFGLALAIQNILWGVGQPFAGAIADRYGTMRVLCAGGLFYAIGLVLMAYSTTPGMLDLGAGVFVGFGLAGCSFSVVLGAFGKLLPERWRSLAFGAGTAAGSFGQFLYSPLAVSLMDAFGWQTALVVFACRSCCWCCRCRLRSRRRPPEPGQCTRCRPQSLRQALSEALRHRSYMLLVLGFFTCGFQLAFITVHMPAYLVDRGLSAEVGGWTIAVIGLFNIVGSLTVRLARRSHAEALHPLVHLFRPRRRGARLHLVSGDAGVRDPVRRGDGPALAVDGRPDQRHHRPDVRHALARDARRPRVLQPSGRRLSRRLARRRRVRAHRLLRCGVVAVGPVRRALGA